MSCKLTHSPCPEGLCILLQGIITCDYLQVNCTGVSQRCSIVINAAKMMRRMTGMPNPTAKFNQWLSLRVKAAPARMNPPKLVSTPPNTAHQINTVNVLNLSANDGKSVTIRNPIAAPAMIPIHCRSQFFLSPCGFSSVDIL